MYKIATELEESDFIPQAQETYLGLIDRYPDTLEKLELGLIPKRDFDIDEKFFEEYKK